MRVNLGCGTARLKDFINVDIVPNDAVDVVEGVVSYAAKLLPNTVDEFACFHFIEHIGRSQHPSFLAHLARTLKVGGVLLISFPDFSVTSVYFLHNMRGQQDFWEATVLGRGRDTYDLHSSLVTQDYLKKLLISVGFTIETITYEPQPNECNCIIKAVKTSVRKSYEELLGE